jgi:hypothetical protein
MKLKFEVKHVGEYTGTNHSVVTLNDRLIEEAGVARFKELYQTSDGDKITIESVSIEE